jgi:hypothetical protein
MRAGDHAGLEGKVDCTPPLSPTFAGQDRSNLMLRNTLTIITGLAIAIWIGSLFVWAGAAFIASVACALLRQWELTSLFALACVCWGYSGLFFARR